MNAKSQSRGSSHFARGHRFTAVEIHDSTGELHAQSQTPSFRRHQSTSGYEQKERNREEKEAILLDWDAGTESGRQGRQGGSLVLERWSAFFCSLNAASSIETAENHKSRTKLQNQRDPLASLAPWRLSRACPIENCAR